MKLNGKSVKAVVKTANQIAPSKFPENEALQNLHLKFSHAGLEIRAFNLSLGLKAVIPCQDGDDDIDLLPEPCLVQAKRFAEIVSALKNEEELVIDHEDGQLLLQFGNTKLALQTSDVEVYPSWENLNDQPRTDVPFNTVLNVIAYCVPFAGTEVWMGNKQGVKIEAKDGYLYALATDNRYMSAYLSQAPYEGQEFLVHRDSLATVKKIAVESGLKQDDAIAIAANETAAFIYPSPTNEEPPGFDWEIFSRGLRLEDYPPAGLLIDKILLTLVNSMTVSLPELIQSIRKVAVVAPKPDYPIDLFLNGESLKLSVHSEIGQAEDAIPAQYIWTTEDRSLSAKTTIQRLQRVISSFDAQEIAFNFKDNITMLVAPVNGESVYAVLSMVVAAEV